MEREEMIERFVKFFREYTEEEEPLYLGKIKDLLTVTPKRSVTINWMHLNSYDPELANEILEHPEEGIGAAEDAIQIILREEFLREDLPRIHARFHNLPETLLVKDIGAEHINKLIQVEGVITRVTEIKPFVSKAVFVCKDCGNEMVVTQRPYEGFTVIKKCEVCGSKNVTLDVDKSSFVNFQMFRIQDRPETLKGGQMPRFIDGILLDDIVDTAMPGDRVLVTGILRVVQERREKTPVFRKILEVNHIEPVSREIEELEITPEDEQKIRELAKRKDIVEAIVDSIAPAIYGYREVKKGIALALFGGVSRTLPDGTRLRGDIHVLLVGDPGVAKSQILRYVSNLAPRAIYTSGKSSSAAGLTAAAVRDEFTGGWVLEAGALVLADGGYALIDELDKMSDRDRSVIHEALEQQTISISKAGITATLNARTTVIAAANPKHGRFNRMKPLFEQIDLPPTLLSRFDLIFVLVDEPDEKLDSEIARHILRVRRGESEVVTPKISHELLRKYIAYAKKNVHPVISEEAMEEIEKYYVRMRRSAKKGSENEGIRPIPITARQLEALIRLSEAHARMRLSPIVTREDAREAIKLMEYTLRQIATDETGQIDVTILEVGQSARKLSKVERILDIIEKLQKTSEKGVHIDDILEEAKKFGIEKQEAREIIEKLLQQGQIYMPETGYYKLL
ncbi:minichromosome maintenance protein MCM [Pyrococcus kukulkanii]|uniref:minichromosome maintenance protein MCM n=1 Tax=Pyrococcus kukulkanii TaxID=1609559 RepID=UPI003563BCEE